MCSFFRFWLSFARFLGVRVSKACDRLACSGKSWDKTSSKIAPFFFANALDWES